MISKKIFNEDYSEGKYLLGEHISREVNGIEFSSGALGHGLPFACGKALALKKDNKKNKVFVLAGDAEFCEGSMGSPDVFSSTEIIKFIYNNRL